MIKVRAARKNDFEAFWKLASEFREYNNKHELIEGFKYELDKTRLNKAFLKQLKQKDSIFIFAENNRIPIGFLFGCIKTITRGGYISNCGKIGYLQSIFISEKHRGKGHSKLLLSHLFDFLRNKKVKLCTLHVNTYNTAAIKAYEKAGFKGPDQYRLYKEL